MEKIFGGHAFLEDPSSCQFLKLLPKFQFFSSFSPFPSSHSVSPPPSTFSRAAVSNNNFSETWLWQSTTFKPHPGGRTTLFITKNQRCGIFSNKRQAIFLQRILPSSDIKRLISWPSFQNNMFSLRFFIHSFNTEFFGAYYESRYVKHWRKW